MDAFMLGYFDYFPEKATTELRTAIFSDESSDSLIPCGTYVFAEFFCTDIECNCQRVLVKVYYVKLETDRPEEVATISYTWCPKNVDDAWSFVNAKMPNPFLDPFHRQASYALELLDFWRNMVARDPAYIARVQRHYHELRSAFNSSQAARRISTEARPSPVLTKRERRLRRRKLEQWKRGRSSR
jgi:hypothetical protein